MVPTALKAEDRMIEVVKIIYSAREIPFPSDNCALLVKIVEILLIIESRL